MRKIRKNKPPIEAITQISIYGERFNAVVCPYCLHTLCLEKDAGKRNINSGVWTENIPAANRRKKVRGADRK